MATRIRKDDDDGSKKRKKPGGYGLPDVDDDDDERRMPASFFDDKPKSAAEILWTEYGIKPNLPRRVKVEQLMVLWRLTVPEIARLLDALQDDITEDIETLKAEWKRMGQPLDDEAREVAKGRAIGELLRYKAQLQESTSGNPDGRLMALLLQVEQQLIKLQGLDEKKGFVEDDEISDPVDEALKGLTPEQRAALLDRMQKSAPA